MTETTPVPRLTERHPLCGPLNGRCGSQGPVLAHCAHRRKEKATTNQSPEPRGEQNARGATEREDFLFQGTGLRGLANGTFLQTSEASGRGGHGAGKANRETRRPGWEPPLCCWGERGRANAGGVKETATGRRASTRELSLSPASLPPSPAKLRPETRASPRCPESCFRLRCSLSRSESSCFLWAWIELHVSDILASRPGVSLESGAGD